MKSKLFVLMGTGGSSGRTLAAVEAQLANRVPGAEFLFLDTQPFNLRTGGETTYPGIGLVKRASADEAGMRAYTNSWSLNMLLNGGTLMQRRLVRYAASLLGGKHAALLMCHDRIYIETATIAAARALSVPTVLIQEGPFCSIGHGKARNSALRVKAALAPMVTKTGILPSIPDYGCAGHDLLLAASAAYRARWIEAGIAPERVKVAGVARYDPLATERSLLCENLSQNGPLRILYLVQPFAAHRKVEPEAANLLQQALREGINRAAQLMPLRLTIRLHPRSGGGDAAVLTGGLRIEAKVDQGQGPLEAALAEHDLVVGHYSSGLLESLLLGKPILVLPVPTAAFAERSEGEKQSWFETIGVPVASTEEQVLASLASIRRGDAQPVAWDRVGEEVGEIDGESSARCAEAILEMLGR